MRRLLCALVLSALVLSGCTPTWDPATGEGYDALTAEYEGMSADERLASIAEGDMTIERSLWAEGELEQELGGADAADEVFAGLFAGLADLRREIEGESAETEFVLASSRTGSQVGGTDADGAGTFLAMLMSSLMADVGVTSSKGGATGDLGRDFGDKTGNSGTLVVESADDGTVTSRMEVHGEYKGAKIDIIVGNDINPCPDATGVLEPRGVYQVNLTGPNGAGSSTQIVVDMEIQLNDDAEIANSDYKYETSYSTRPQTGGSVFDFTTRSVTFTRDFGGAYDTSDLSVAGFWDDEFLKNATKVGDFFSRWIADSTEKAAQKGWEDGRCIDLQGSYSAGPKGLKPKSSVTATLTPIAKSDGAPAGGSVTAKLTDGVKAITPEGAKVTSPADFTYTASDKKDESGTVRFEARSKRGVGILTVVFDTKEQSSYFMKGGGGDFHGTGFICDLGTPWSIEGSGVKMDFTPTSDSGGTYSYKGNMGGIVVYGGEAYSVTFDNGVATKIKGWGVGTVVAAGYERSGYGEEFYELTPIERPPACD